MCFQRYFQELQTWDGTGQKYLLKFLPWFEETGRGVPWHAGSCPVLIPIYHYFYYCYYFYFYYHLIPIALQDLSNLCFLSDSCRQLIRSKSPGVSPTFHIFHLQCPVLSSSCELFLGSYLGEFRLRDFIQPKTVKSLIQRGVYSKESLHGLHSFL